MKNIFLLMRLTKFPIILLSTLSAATGYILTGTEITIKFPLFILSLMTLAAGSASLNQVQDRKFDALMERTRNRPIPSGEITPFAAGTISTVLLILGSASMLMIFGTIPFFAGTLTVILYNGIYTYFKRISPYAVLPGALIGALPPAIGWSAAAGDIRSVTLIGVMFFFYLWQIPHFWLLLGLHSKEYLKAGYPVITKTFSLKIFSRIIFIWITAVLCSGILLPVFGIFSHKISVTVVALITVYILVSSLPLLNIRTGVGRIYKKSFNNINIFALAIILVIIFEKGVFK